MQLFRTEEKLAPQSAPRYDSETVREVLVRASEIETQADTELLTATQVEALGGELGLSPEAVRRALGEKTSTLGGHTVTRRTALGSAILPLTQERVRTAYLSNLWYALATMVFIFSVSRLMRSGTTPHEIGSSLAIAVAFVIPVFLAFRSGFLTRSAKVGAAGGFLTVFVINAVTVLACAMAGESASQSGMMAIMLWDMLAGGVAGAAGAGAGRWWDSLPRESQRRNLDR